MAVKKSLDKKEMVMEMVKCTQSAEYFLSTYGMVYHPKKGHVKFRLFDYQKEQLESFQNNRFNIILKSRQCLPKETCVDTPSGPINIEDLNVGDEVFSYNFDTNSVVVDDVWDAWKSGERNCIKIKLRDTRNIEVGENHPFYIENKGWVKSKDLVLGDKILDSNFGFGNCDSTVEEMKLLGYLLTDGSTHKQIKFTNNNIEYLNEFESCSKTLFPELFVTWREKENGYDLYPHNKCGTNTKNSIKSWCEKVGINKKTVEKLIPEYVFSLKREYISILINRMFAGDGWVSIKNSGNSNRLEIGIASPSKLFLEQIKFLLKKFGITCNIYEVKNMKLQKNKFYKLRITHSKSVKIFVEDIGIFGKINDIHFEIVKSFKHDVKFDSVIKKLEYIGNRETYDISVSNNENYLVNGLVVHNTGISTLTAGYIAWMICFHSAKEIVVVADKQDNAQGFIRKIKTFITKTPSWMVPTLLSDNKKSIELSNGSKVSAQATTGNAGRSASLSLLVIDEAAIVDTNKVDDLWASAYPTLSLGGAAIIISTPLGVGNWYHKQWQAAINKESDFTPLIAHWTDNPIYGMDTVWICQKCGNEQNYGRFNQLKEPIPCNACGKNYLLPTSPWYEEQKKQLGDPRKVAQELDMDFLGSGENVIREEYIREAEKNCRVPSRICGFDNNLWIWREPEKGVEYLISSDVARGDGSDASAAHVIDINRKEQVAEYRGKLPPDLFAKFLNDLGYEYNNALLITEANSIGYATCLKLVEMEYPNIFYSMKGFNGRDRMKLEQAYRHKESMIPGFQTTLTSRPLVYAQLEQEIRTNSVIIHSTRLISELRTLIYNNGRPEAMYGYHDDLSISMAIGLYVMVTTLSDLLATRESVEASLRALGSELNPMDTVKVLNKSFSVETRKKNPWAMVTSKGTNEDLGWLIGRNKGK